VTYAGPCRFARSAWEEVDSRVRTGQFMDRGIALLLTLLAGGLVALQPPANRLLADQVGDLGAAFTSLLFSTVIVGCLLLAFGSPSDLGGIGGFRPVHLLGAIAGAAIVAISLITVRTLGAGGVAAALVSMQLIVAALLDQLGMLGLDRIPVTWWRVLGIALLIVGTLLVTAR
jgi:bacterial/archaeal transporter family-2 protein